MVVGRRPRVKKGDCGEGTGAPNRGLSSFAAALTVAVATLTVVDVTSVPGKGLSEHLSEGNQ